MKGKLQVMIGSPDVAVAFNVLRKSYGVKDVEWTVICAIRDEAGVRNATPWQGRN